MKDIAMRPMSSRASSGSMTRETRAKTLQRLRRRRKRRRNCDARSVAEGHVCVRCIGTRSTERHQPRQEKIARLLPRRRTVTVSAVGDGSTGLLSGDENESGRRQEDLGVSVQETQTQKIGFDRGGGGIANQLKKWKPIDTLEAEIKESKVNRVSLPAGIVVGNEEGKSEVLESLVEEWDGGNESTDTDEEGIAISRGVSPATITKNAQTSRVVYEVLRVGPSGRASSIVLSKKDILRHFGIVPRDLRRVDPSLSLTTTPPALLVRDKALLLNLGGVRTIVTQDELFIFEPWRDAGQAFLNNFRDRIETKRSEGESNAEGNTILGIDGQLTSGHRSEKIRGLDSSDGRRQSETGGAVYDFKVDIPFELEAVEAALIVATQNLEEMMISSARRLSDLMSSMPSQSKVTAERLEELRRVKQVLLQLDAQAGALRQTMLDLLDDDEDVRGMVFIETTSEETKSEMDDAIEEEVENLIEYYLQRHETCHSEAERLLSGARDLEESLSVSLSSRRYEVTRMELTLSIASFATSLGAMIAGIFGMNLQSRLEMSVTAFYGTSGAIIFGAVCIFIFIFRLMKQKMIL